MDYPGCYGLQRTVGLLLAHQHEFMIESVVTAHWQIFRSKMAPSNQFLNSSRDLVATHCLASPTGQMALSPHLPLASHHQRTSQSNQLGCFDALLHDCESADPTLQTSMTTFSYFYLSLPQFDSSATISYRGHPHLLCSLRSKA